MPFAIGMGAFGALLGLWIVLSASPVVITLLPLLFGLIGGAGGYSLLKMDLSKPGNEAKVRLVGIGLGTLCSCCFLVMVAMLVARPALQRWTDEPKAIVEASARYPLHAIAIRARLRALGASEEEIGRALKAIEDRDLTRAYPSVLAAAKNYIAVYDETPATDRAILDEHVAALRVRQEAQEFVLAYNALTANDSKPLTAEYAELLAASTPSLNAYTNSVTERLSDDAQGARLRNPTLMVAQLRLAYAVSQLRNGRFGLEEVNSALQALGVAKSTRQQSWGIAGIFGTKDDGRI